MEVSAQLISVPDLCCQDNRKRMMELQERRRSLQVVLSNRLAELRCLCLQEAELTGKVPSDYPLETEEPPLVRRSVGFSHDKTAARPEEEGEVSQRCKLKKTLFIKRTVHRGCHTVGGASSPLGGGASKDAVPHSSSEALSAEESSRPSPSRPGQVQAPRRAAEYGDLLQEYVWGKQHKQQLQTQLHSNSRQPIVCQIPPAPPLLRGHPGEPGRVKVTRTKSCGPFLSPEPPEPPVAIQPDPHPHLQPPRPPQPPPTHDTQPDPARTLHKALALEGLRDWYLRNTSGSAQQTLFDGKGKGGAPDRRGGGGGGGGGGGRAPQCTQTAHGVIQRLAYQRETNQQAPQKHPIERQHLYAGQMQHSVTFHGQELHGRSTEGSLYHDFLSDRQVPPLKEPLLEQASPGTLV
ncbi:unnamed protein product [Lota lota]